MKNKIGWCNATWNPVWGCLNHCPYCYARAMAKRFWNRMYINEFNHYWKKHPDWVWTGDPFIGLKDFVPIFLESQFDKKLSKKPQRIFVGSMSEIAHWEDKWLEKVLEKVKLYPQHIFQFLTRYPEVYDRYIFPKNCWLGVTITREKDFERGIPYLFITSCNITFVSVEPVLEYINPRPFSNANIDWVILGAETGNRKDKVVPGGEWIFDWVYDVVKYCNENKISLYVKDSIGKLYPGYPDTGEQKEFPEVK